MPVTRIITKISDLIFLTYELLVSNRRLIIPTMIGLIIALSVVSQSGVLVESYREQIFVETVFKTNPYNAYEGHVEISDYTDSREGGVSKFTSFNTYNDYLNQSIFQVDYQNYVEETLWCSDPNIGYWRVEKEPYEEIWEENERVIVSSSQEFYDKLNESMNALGIGRIPVNNSEIVLIRPNPLSTPWYWDEFIRNLTIGLKINFTTPGYYIEGDRINKTVTIVGILEYDDIGILIKDSLDSVLTPQTNISILLQKYYGNLWGNAFLTTPDLLLEILTELTTGNVNAEIHGEIKGKIFLKISQFNAFNYKTEYQKLQQLVQSIEQIFRSAGFYPYVRSSIMNAIRDFDSLIFALILILTFVSLPVLVIALYLVIYSFGLIRRQKQEQIGIIKTRGGSWTQILAILLGEMLISTFFAILVGIVVSYFFGDLVMRSTDYLQFLGSPVRVVLTRSLFETLLIWGLIFALLLNFRRIIQMSRQDITETLEPTEKRDPLWKRYYLDIAIFIIGTAVWISVMAIQRGMLSGGIDYNPFLYLVLMILQILFLPAPFLMFFGTIMVISRFFPFLMRKLSDIAWRVEGGVNSFAIRNIVRHKQAANRAVLLITLALSFSILSSSLIFSLDETEKMKKFYSEGADISLEQGNRLNKTIYTLLKENITQLSSISGIYLADHSQYGYLDLWYRFLFVDPTTYANVAFNLPIFKLSDSLSSLMNKISDNQSVVLFEGNLKKHIPRTSIGNNFSLLMGNDTKQEQVTFKIAGTFKYWPQLYPEYYYDFSRYYWIIGSLGLFEKLNQTNYLNNILGKYQAKLNSINNVEEAVEKITNVTKLTPYAPALEYKEYHDSFTRIFTLSILNSDLIICVAVSVVGIIMFAFFTYVERGKEIGVERALGMTKIQTAQSFLVEGILILGFGTIIGVMTGIYFVAMFLQAIQFGQDVPPQIISYPTTLLIQMLVGILLIAGIGTLIPSIMASRKDISRILKVE